MAQVIQHYNGITAPHIKYYELWNEANAGNFWSGSVNDMVALAQAAYPIIHSDPNALLLTPSVTGPVNDTPHSASVWMTDYLKAGGWQYADGGTFHGYTARTGVSPYPMPEQDATAGCTGSSVNCYSSILTKVAQMRAVFDQNGLAGKPIFDTEGSWGVTTNVADLDTQVAW